MPSRSVPDPSIRPAAGSTKPKIDYLREHLVALPLHRVIIRSVECRLLARYRYDRPLLDVGCGDGHFGSVLFPEGIDVGVDPSPAAVSEAASRGVYRELKVASATELPFPDGAFPSVISNCVLEHIPDLMKALDEIARVTKPGGLFVLTVPSINYERFLLGYSFWSALRLGPLARAYGRWMTTISHHYHYYTVEEWQRRLTARGFSLREWQYYGSSGSHKLFDLSHYLSAPSLLVRKLTGRWILFPSKPGIGLQRAVLSRYYDEDNLEQGAYLMMACVKSPDPAGANSEGSGG